MLRFKKKLYFLGNVLELDLVLTKFNYIQHNGNTEKNVCCYAINDVCTVVFKLNVEMFMFVLQS